MYKVNDKTTEVIERTTFKELKMDESQIEEYLRKNTNMITDEDESLLIIGQQVTNNAGGRSDLTAIDGQGKIVLIEVKRDKKDIENRKESFEFQAIRYAASYAKIDTIEEVVNEIYIDYISKYRQEPEFLEYKNLTNFEVGIRKIRRFIDDNVDTFDSSNFNEKQRIVLVAGEFDRQTLSAVSWLASNGLDISCFELIPYAFKDEVIIQSNKIIPLNTYNDFYVDIKRKQGVQKTSGNITRTQLPKIRELMDASELNICIGDILVAKDKPDEIAYLQPDGTVNVSQSDGENKSLQQWLKEVYGWSSVATYNFVRHKKSGKLLKDIREDYIKSLTEEVTLH